MFAKTRGLYRELGQGVSGKGRGGSPIDSPEVALTRVAQVVGVVLQDGRSRVQSTVGAQAWVAGSIPSRGVYKTQLTDASLSH